jgi:hypothetical protein
MLELLEPFLVSEAAHVNEQRGLGVIIGELSSHVFRIETGVKLGRVNTFTPHLDSLNAIRFHLLFHLRRGHERQVGSIMNPSDNLPRPSLSDCPWHNFDVLLGVSWEVGMIGKDQRYIQHFRREQGDEYDEPWATAVDDFWFESVHRLPDFPLFNVKSEANVVVEWEAKSFDIVDRERPKLNRWILQIVHSYYFNGVTGLVKIGKHFFEPVAVA